MELTDDSKILIAVSVLPLIGEFLEDLTFDNPNVFRHELKRSVKRLNDEIEKHHKVIFGVNIKSEEYKREIAQQLVDIRASFFNEWVKNHFE